MKKLHPLFPIGVVLGFGSLPLSTRFLTHFVHPPIDALILGALNAAAAYGVLLYVTRAAERKPDAYAAPRRFWSSIVIWAGLIVGNATMLHVLSPFFDGSK